MATYLFLLPLFIFVLCAGFQRWGKQRSGSAAVKTSHIDVFTYNMVLMDLINFLGIVLYCCGSYTNQAGLQTSLWYISSITTPGQMLLHTLTCVERYLAVVHPVTYLGLRRADGSRIRDGSIVCVWLLSISMITTAVFFTVESIAVTIVLLAICSVVITFCTVSVLCVLIRPGPGEVGGNQSKLRAFHSTMAIMGVLLVRLVGTLVTSLVQVSAGFSHTVCLMVLAGFWYSPPSSLVLPLLFLQRAGMLPGCSRRWCVRVP